MGISFTLATTKFKMVLMSSWESCSVKVGALQKWNLKIRG